VVQPHMMHADKFIQELCCTILTLTAEGLDLEYAEVEETDPLEESSG